MVTTLTDIQLSAALRATLTDTIETVNRVANAGAGVSLSLANGTSANQADQFIQDLTRTITSGNNEDLDLFDLAGFAQATDPLKNTITFADVTGILIINASSSAGNLRVGNNGTTAAWDAFLQGDAHEFTLPPDSFFCIGTRNDPGWAVADTTSHLLRMAANGGNVTYGIHLLGRSA